MLAISTSWMEEAVDLEKWVGWVQDLGFDAVELGYKLSGKQLKELQILLREHGIGVASVHNFCPVPSDTATDRHASNHYRLSSVDEQERRLAVKWTKVSVDTAEHFGARAVVIHAGTLDFEDVRVPLLYHMYSNGQRNSKSFRAERERILKAREEKKRPYIAALEQSLNEIVVYSRKKGILIGLETRYYPIEIPNFEEIGYFLRRFDEREMGYWHDVGHAEINDRLGIRPHADFLDAYKDRLIGVHLHGMKGKKDHYAPFEGDLDLGALLPHFKGDVIRVVEAKPYADIDLLRDAVGKLKDL